MNELTASIVTTIRTSGSVEKLNSLYAEALAIDTEIETAVRGPECIDADHLCKLTDDGRALNEQLQRAAYELHFELEEAGLRVVSAWGDAGDFSIFLKPYGETNVRTEQFLLTSDLTFLD